MDRMSPGPVAQGLTLIELMVTLAVLALVLTLGGPALEGLQHSTRLRAESLRLASAINLARSEAIGRNQPVSLCPSAMASTGHAACSGNYAGGWIVFSNPEKDQRVDPVNDRLIRAFGPVADGYTLTNRDGTGAVSGLITYLPDGSSRRNLTLLLCPPAGGRVQPWSVVLNRVGRARLSREGGTCPVL